MNMKKIAILALSLCMIAAIAVTGTIAYFTDVDGATNVMTTGNVKIVQNEKERGENGLVDFTDNQKLAPYTGKVNENGMATEYGDSANINGKDYTMFDQDKNAIDKIVTVTNEGTEECYVRTLFAWEMIEVDGEWVMPIMGNNKYIYTNAVKGMKGGMPVWTYDADNEFGLDVKKGDYVTFDLDGVKYAVARYYYNDESKLGAGKTTHPSLTQFYLNANLDNEWYDYAGKDGKYNLLVLSQAVQTEGFATADEAFAASFGEYYKVGPDKLAEWFEQCK